MGLTGDWSSVAAPFSIFVQFEGFLISVFVRPPSISITCRTVSFVPYSIRYR